MKNIIEIYKEYKIMPNLVKHQMRVAAVAMQVCDSFDLEIDKDSIIKACLLHDMGNIIKFKLDNFPEWNEPEGLEYWEKVKSEYILKYGENEHHASLNIAQKLGVSTHIQTLIDSVDSSHIEDIFKENDFSKKICIYADNRVTPNGVVSTEEHGLEAQKRYMNHPQAFSEENRLFFNTNIFLIETQIFSHTNIKPEDINDESIKDLVLRLEDYII
jgi:putative nucleotidyltransferase with HDIG domain